MVTDLSVVSAVEGHALVPEVLEEGGQDLVLDVLRLHTISGTTLLHHLVDRNTFTSNTTLQTNVKTFEV